MRRTVLAAALLAAFAVPLLADDKPSPPQKLAEIPLEGTGAVRGIALDPASSRVFVSHGADVDVVDVEKKEKVGTLSGVEAARGVLVLAEPRKGFVVSAKKLRLLSFDPEALEVKKEIATGDGPDGILYVSSAKEVWVFNTKTNSATCVDPASSEVKATIPFPGSPQNAVEHASKGLVYVDVVGPDGVAVVNVSQHKVVGAVHPIEPGTDPEGIALDAKDNLAFVTCGNGKMTILETNGWKPVGSYDIGLKSGGAAFDPGTMSAFALGEERIRVIKVTPPKTFGVLPSLDAPDARVCVLDPKTHRLYVATSPGKGEEGAASLLVFGPK